MFCFLQHPFIVECYMAVQTDKQLFFISEFIQVHLLLIKLKIIKIGLFGITISGYAKLYGGTNI